MNRDPLHTSPSPPGASAASLPRSPFSASHYSHTGPPCMAPCFGMTAVTSLAPTFSPSAVSPEFGSTSGLLSSTILFSTPRSGSNTDYGEMRFSVITSLTLFSMRSRRSLWSASCDASDSRAPGSVA